MIARIRTVKPALFVHSLLFDLEQLTALPMRLSYIGIWCWTDREGRFEWKPRELKVGILPHDDCDFGLVLNVFANAGFVVKYMVDGRYYGWVPRFLDHQNLNGRESPSDLPPPPPEAVRLYEDLLLQSGFRTLSCSELLAEPDLAAVSASAKRINDLRERSRVADASTTRAARDTAGRGRGREGEEEGKGEEQRGARSSSNGDESSERDRPSDAESEGSAPDGGGGGASADRRSDPVSQVTAHGSGSALVVHDASRNVPALPAVRGVRNALAIRERLGVVFEEIAAGTRSRVKREQLDRLHAEIVFMYWAHRFDHKLALLDAKRERCIMARLKENDGNVSELLYALDGAYHDDWIMGRTEQSTKVYDAIPTIFRDRNQVERFAATRKNYTRGVEHKALAAMRAAVEGSGDASSSNGNASSNGNGTHSEGGAPT